MANYFVNSANTGATKDGTSAANAWTTIERPLAGSNVWTSAPAGGPNTGGPITGSGHTVYIKDDHAEVWDLVGLGFVGILGMGTMAAPIIFKKDDGTGWTLTGSTPSVTTANSSNAFFRDANPVAYVVFDGIDFIRSTATNDTPLFFYDARITRSYVHFKNCSFTAYKALYYCSVASSLVMDNCTFDRTGYVTANGTTIDYEGTTYTYIRDSIFTGDPSYKADAFIEPEYATMNGIVELDCVTVSNHDIVFDIGTARDIQCIARGLDMSTGVTTEVSYNATAFNDSRVIIQDINDNPRLAKHYLRNGTIWTVEGVTDHDPLIKVNPSSTCHEYNKIKVFEFWVPADAADGAVDYSIQAYATSWSVLPTVDQFVFEVGYYDTASSSSRTWAASSDVFDAAITWETFTVPSITNAEDGFVILRGWLGGYEDGTEEVWVDVVDDGAATHWWWGYPYREPAGGGVSGGTFMLTDDG
jgi:hypothetical protein